MHLFGIDFSSFFQPLLALCGALALVLNARNQDLSRLLRSGAEQATRRENGEYVADAERRDFLRRQALVFRERLLIVQQGLLFTYLAGICLTLMVCFLKLPFRGHDSISGCFGVLGVLGVILACASAIRDIGKSTDSFELEMISAYGPDILPHRASFLACLLDRRQRGLWVRFAEGMRAFSTAFRDNGEDSPPAP